MYFQRRLRGPRRNEYNPGKRITGLPGAYFNCSGDTLRFFLGVSGMCINVSRKFLCPYEPPISADPLFTVGSWMNFNMQARDGPIHDVTI